MKWSHCWRPKHQLSLFYLWKTGKNNTVTNKKNQWRTSQKKKYARVKINDCSLPWSTCAKIQIFLTFFGFFWSSQRYCGVVVLMILAHQSSKENCAFLFRFSTTIFNRTVYNAVVQRKSLQVSSGHSSRVCVWGIGSNFPSEQRALSFSIKMVGKFCFFCTVFIFFSLFFSICKQIY